MQVSEHDRPHPARGSYPVAPHAKISDTAPRPSGRASVNPTPTALFSTLDEKDARKDEAEDEHSYQLDGDDDVDESDRSQVRSHRRRRFASLGEDSHAASTDLDEPMIRKVIRTSGEIFITLGLVILLFAAYEVYGKSFQVHADQDRLSRQLDKQWSHHSPRSKGDNADDKPLPGDAIARIYVPSLNKDWVIVEGVTPSDIKLSPGHYPQSQMPGDMGNFAVAGHRIPAIFWDLDKMASGDVVVVETQDNWFVYNVTQVHIIKPTEIDVVDANPDSPGAPPTRKLLTLTTCNPKWGNYQRLVVQAELAREQPKSQGRPSELKG